MPLWVPHEWAMSSIQISYENSFSQIGLQQKNLLFETDFSPAQSLKALETALDSV